MWPYLIGPYIPAMLFMQLWFMYRCWASWDTYLFHPGAGGEQENFASSVSPLPSNIIYLRRGYIPRVPGNETQPLSASPRLEQSSASNVIPLTTALIKR